MDNASRLLEKKILENPRTIEDWRQLHDTLLLCGDIRAASFAKTISGISREVLASAAPARHALAEKEDIASAQDSNSNLEDEKERAFSASLELAHKLIDLGDLRSAKAKLIRLLQTPYAHINAWASYFLAKCFFDQYHLTTASWLIKRLPEQSETSGSIGQLIVALGDAINDGLNYQSDLCAHYIKPSFYERQFKKARPHSELSLTSSHDCYKHYQTVGFRLGINPTPWFETRRYLSENRDIAKSGCCPFFHYLAAGKNEGRLASGYSSRFSSEVENQKSLPSDIFEESRNWIQVLPSANQINSQELSQFLCHPYVLSVSHDCYYKIPGGIQLCIQREQKCFQEQQVDYIHVYARQPWPIPLHNRSPYTELMISRNGGELGVINLTDLGKAIEFAAPSALLIHSLLGISPEDIEQIIIRSNIQNVVYWMHDYSALCSSYQLLRNRVTFCGAPPLGSRQCDYCFYGNSRNGNVDSISKVLDLPQTELAFPSQAALEAWRAGNQSSPLSQKQKVSVVNHITLVESSSVHRDYSGRRPSIAFLGHPAFAKGWDTFSELVRDPDLFTLFEWYHLGATKADLSNDIEFIHVSIADSPTAMIDMVKEAQIDFVLVWPEWPETFCLTAYEAVIGGANIITNPNSGNVARFAQSHPYGHVIDGGIKELKKFLLSLLPLQIQSLSFPENVNYEYSRMSAELVAQ
jgi:hypothetical protein